ncbi:unnamed protein product [Caretta caretta]
MRIHCTTTPALKPELETHLLRAALHAVFTLGMEKDTTEVQHINYWIMSRVSQERARAIRSSTALLRFTITLPEFDNSAEFPTLGHHVAQLALFISDPAKDISWQAREGVFRLYQLLLHQRGLRKVLLGGAEKILPPDGSAGHPRPTAACQPGWAAPHLLPPGGSPAADGGHGSEEGLPRDMDAKLKSLLTATPSIDKLQHILELISQ